MTCPGRPTGTWNAWPCQDKQPPEKSPPNPKPNTQAKKPGTKRKTDA